MGKKRRISTCEEIIDGVHILRFDAFSVNISSTLKLIPNPIMIRDVYKTLEKEIMDSDILHLQTGHGSLNILAAILTNISKKGRKCTIVYTSHGVPGGYDSFLLNFGSTLAKKVIRWLIIRNCKLITTVGLQDLEYWVKRGVPRENISYIPNGVDTKIFRPSTTLRNRYRKQLGFHIDDFVVLFLAQFRKAKGLTTLLAAMPEIVSSVHNIKFLLAGSGPMTRNVKSFIRKFDLETKVKLLLHYIPDEDLPGLYNASDIYILPSFIEGMPLSLMEAMACAKPVIATNVGDVPLLVKDGVNGFLIPPGDPEILVQKIIHLYSRPELKKIMETNNAEKMLKFDWDNISKKYLQLYLQLMLEKSINMNSQSMRARILV
jgi:glycosyltransferase involved in cell wall biosynthesis